LGENSRKLAEDVYDEKIVLKAYKDVIKNLTKKEGE